MSLKNRIYSACMKSLNDKIADHNQALHDLTAGAGNDIKSSAGDKHETARAMMQLEHEKISRQLQELVAQKESLQKIDVTVMSLSVIRGSLIKTDKGYLFLSVALGRINVDEFAAIALSPQSPLGQQLIGLKKSDEAVINKTVYFIEEII